ncbi:MAG TPA: Sec-independent protein translocase protein TatB [Arenimonas sp.]|nr:Sec-independent protein translocase protein TatB [Arenimonas sp.]
MFDLGFSELLVIAVVALVVLGPERLPKAARFAGLWVRKARAQWYSVKSEFEREMAADELKRSIGDPARELRGDVEDIRRELDETSALTGQAVREAEASTRDEPAPAIGKPIDPPDEPSREQLTDDDAANDTGDTPNQPSLLPPRRDD